MAMDELLPPACAFAVSVLAERDQDPDSVPEEAIEAAEHHMATCVRCLSSAAIGTPARKKKKARRAPDQTPTLSFTQTLVEEPVHTPLAPTPAPAQVPLPVTPIPPFPLSPAPSSPPSAPSGASLSSPFSSLPAVITGSLDCQQCRQRLKEYAGAMDSGQNVAQLYPEMQDHLLSCESGCLVLLDLFRSEAKANRKYRRRAVRDPFRAISWEVTGFFRGGQLTISPRALSYGTLLLLILWLRSAPISPSAGMMAAIIIRLLHLRPCSPPP